MSKEIVIVFGSNGQLGQSIKHVIDKKNKLTHNFVFLSKQQSNILDKAALDIIFKTYLPKYVINCAAYTNVDLAEDNKEDAYAINVLGVKYLAQVCKRYKSCLIHISTDFVFEGNTLKFLDEDAICKPINYYGLTKLEGEQEIQNIITTHFIIRTSWLYSEFGNNFVKTMLRLGLEKESLQVVEDQIGAPTYAVNLAEFIIKIIEINSKKFGTYHYSNQGLCSWYDFSKSIFEYTNTPIKVYPVASSVFKTKANRPKFSVMSKQKVIRNFDIDISHWRTSLKKCLEKISL